MELKKLVTPFNKYHLCEPENAGKSLIKCRCKSKTSSRNCAAEDSGG